MPVTDLRDRRTAAWLLVVAVLAVAAVYSRALSFDLAYDDHWVLRPWTSAELRQTFHGTWDPTGNNEPYYRPLTSLNQAAMFWFFGLNGPAHHAVSLIEFAIVAWMIGLVIVREGASAWMAAAAVVFYVVHPWLPFSASAMIIHQTHLLGSIVVLLSVLAWQRCRHAGTRAWWAVGLLTAIGLLLKEDLILILPALLILQTVTARWIGGVPAPDRKLIASAAGLLLILAAGRTVAYSQFGTGHVWPSMPWGAMRMLLHAPYRAFNIQDEPLAALCLIGLLVAGLAALIARPAGPGLRLTVLGIALLVVFAPPHLLLTGRTRMHLTILAATFVLSGGLVALADRLRHPVGRAVLGGLIAVCLVVEAGATGRALALWAPCNLIFANEIEATSAPGVPVEIGRWAARQPERCASAGSPLQTRTLEYAVWGASTPAADGDARVLAQHAVALVNNSAAEVRLRLRRADVASIGRVQVAIVVNGRATTSVDLTASGWQTATVPLHAGFWSWLRDMHRLDLYITSDASPTAPVELGALELARSPGR